MKEEEFNVEVVKFITKALLDCTNNQSETLKIITIGVRSVLNTKSEEKKTRKLR